MFIWGIKIVPILLLRLQGSVALVFVSEYGQKNSYSSLTVRKNSFYKHLRQFVTGFVSVIYNDSFLVPDARILYKSLCQFLISAEGFK